MDFVSLTCAHSPHTVTRRYAYTLDPGVEYRYIGMLTDYGLYSRLLCMYTCFLLSLFDCNILNCYFTSLVSVGRSVDRSVDSYFTLLLTSKFNMFCLCIIFSSCPVSFACVVVCTIYIWFVHLL